MAGASTAPVLSQELLLSIAEQIKLPLLQIARQAEIARLTSLPNLDDIQTTADNALRLIDNYLLSVRLSCEQELLAMESVSVSSVLYDAGHEPVSYTHLTLPTNREV